MLLRALFALGLSLAATPAWAGQSSQPGPEILAHYQERHQRLQDIGWRLVRGNAPFCERTLPSIGLTLQDMAGFGSPDEARAALGLMRSFAVQSAATSSPAAKAGLTANQEVVAIAGDDPNLWPAAKRLDWKRLTRAHDAIDARLLMSGQIELSIAPNQPPMVIQGEAVCASRFELASDDNGARADGARVVIGEAFVGFDYPADELAAAIAHELAHNLLGHRTWLEAKGRKQRNVRLSEQEADRLMPWLLANAGYSPAAASRFMAKWGPRHGGGIFRARSHDGWDERLESISAEVALVEQLMSEGQAADWKHDFRRVTAD